MDAALKEYLVSKLRHGNLRKSVCRLRDVENDKWCPVGIIADYLGILDKNTGSIKTRKFEFRSVIPDEYQSYFDDVGMSRDTIEQLMSLNRSLTFSEMADHIEWHY